MTQTINIQELTKKVEAMIEVVRNGGRSQYVTFTINEDTDKEEDITVRVADHMANPDRISGRTIFFIVEDNTPGGSHISKKSFTAVAGRIYLDKNNCDESGNGVEYLLDYELN